MRNIKPNQIVYCNLTVSVPSKYKNRPANTHTIKTVFSIGNNWDGWLRIDRPIDEMVLTKLSLDHNAQVTKIEVLVELGFRSMQTII